MSGAGKIKCLPELLLSIIIKNGIEEKRMSGAESHDDANLALLRQKGSRQGFFLMCGGSRRSWSPNLPTWRG